MPVRTISTSIKLDGEAEFKKQMSNVNGELRNLNSEMRLVTEQFKGNANSMEALEAKAGILTEEIDQQREKVRALEKALEDSTEAYGDADSRTDKYRQSLNNAKTDLLKFQRELDDTNKYLDEARKSADRTARSIDGFGNEVKNVDSGGLMDLIDNLKSLKGVAIGGAIAGAVKGVGEQIFEVVEASEEYRKIMGTLEVSSTQAGYTADETQEAYGRLFSVLGDPQSTATAVANLQALGISQESLMQLIDGATGAWATYGDSIPIDGLAEAINESVKTGQVTGVLADVLNWAGTSEEEFNKQLKATSSESYRARLVLNELTQQGLVEASEAWRDLNPDIVAANESQSKWNEATARLGETLAPARDALRNFGADVLEHVLDVLDDTVIFFTEDVPEGLNVLKEEFEKLPEKLDEFVAEFGEIGRNVINGFIDGIKEKWDAAIAAVSDFVGDIKEVFTGSPGFDEHSPSKWAMTVAEYMMQGLVIGMENSKGEVMEAASDIVDEVKSRFDGLVDALDLKQEIGDLEYELWEKTYGQAATEAEKYDQKLKNLNAQETVQAGVVDAAYNAYLAVSEQYGENSAQSLEYQKALLQEELQYYDLLNAIKDVQAAKEALSTTGNLSVLEASTMQQLLKSPPSVQQGVTALDLQTATAATVNAMGMMQGGANQPITLNATLTMDGAVVARKQFRYNQAEVQRHGKSLVNT